MKTLSIVMMTGSVLVQVRCDVTPDATDYCDPRYQCSYFDFFYDIYIPLKNVRCRFKIQTEPNHVDCDGLKFLTRPTLRKRILVWLNNYRNTVASGKSKLDGTGAKNMRQVSWDHRLEEMSLVLASYCKFHTKDRDIFFFPPSGATFPAKRECTKTPEFPQGTTLIAWSGVGKLGARRIVQIWGGWASEDIPTGLIDEYYPSSQVFIWGKITVGSAIVWANVYKIGCALVSCNCRYNAPDDEFQDILEFACFVGPEANVVSEPIFLRGDSCQECQQGTKCNNRSAWPDLCALSDDPSDADGITGIENIAFPDRSDVSSPVPNNIMLIAAVHIIYFSAHGSPNFGK